MKDLRNPTIEQEEKELYYRVESQVQMLEVKSKIKSEVKSQVLDLRIVAKTEK